MRDGWQDRHVEWNLTTRRFLGDLQGVVETRETLQCSCRATSQLLLFVKETAAFNLKAPSYNSGLKVHYYHKSTTKNN
jgi:hypothetical protein